MNGTMSKSDRSVVILFSTKGNNFLFRIQEGAIGNWLTAYYILSEA